MNLGASQSDTEELRFKKAVLTLISGLIALLAILWGSLYIYAGYPFSGAIPLAYAFISFCTIIYFFSTQKFFFFRFSQFLLMLILPFLLMWSLGGFANSSVVLIWAFFTPLAALFFNDLKSAFRWVIAFLILIIVSGAIDPFVSKIVPPMPIALNISFFVMNMGAGFLLIFIVIHYFVKDRESANIAALTAKEEALKSKEELEHAYKRLQNNEIKIRELMLTDALTGLPNRRFLDERLNDEIQRLKRYGNQLSLILTDLDFFKNINDSYGHNKGDEILVEFSKILKQDLRPTDFSARFGGEEFLVILPETSIQAAEVIAERIRKQMKSIRVEGVTENISASFGVTNVAANETATEAFIRVDKALYQSKKMGRNTVTAIAK
ncbi:MAG TPA: GGDEF domain-containing protein [Gammaproteobacteria bacterium]|nr:GGDEF domain-containing protein [Gammaproteobacteria bacterium]